jgi:3-hydroxyisobutyrate dehydrogenase-like beta-hydroxyacid dehydrogenase
MASIAFLGLGVMGFPMAGHLKNKGGHEIVSRAVLPLRRISYSIRSYP